MIASLHWTSSSPFQLNWLSLLRWGLPPPPVTSPPQSPASRICFCLYFRDSRGLEPLLALIWVLGGLHSDPHVCAASTLTSEPSSSPRISISRTFSGGPEANALESTQRSVAGTGPVPCVHRPGHSKEVLSLAEFNACWCEWWMLGSLRIPPKTTRHDAINKSVFIIPHTRGVIHTCAKWWQPWEGHVGFF